MTSVVASTGITTARQVIPYAIGRGPSLCRSNSLRSSRPFPSRSTWSPGRAALLRSATSRRSNPRCRMLPTCAWWPTWRSSRTPSHKIGSRSRI